MAKVALRVRHIAAGESGITDGAPDWIYFQVEAGSGLIRGLMSPLSFAFDSRRRLMVFRGESNVKVEQGGKPLVLIRYKYGVDPASS